MKKYSRQYNRGFTFVELIMVTAILAIVGLAIYGAFNSGINVWQRVTQTSETEDIALFMKNISFDMRNSFKFEGIRFRGGRTEVRFPTRIKQAVKGKIEETIGEVAYSFDRRKGELYKVQSDYSQIYRKKPGRERVLAQGISSLDFQYYVFDAEDEKYRWEQSWQESDEPFGAEKEYNLPLIVKIEIGVPEGNFEKKFVKTVVVPSACCWPFIEDEETIQ